DARRMLRVVQNGLPSDTKLCVLAESTAGVGISVEPRKVAARDLHANPVAGQEHIARRANVDRELHGLIRHERRWRRLALAVSRSKDAICQGARRAVWKDVNELGGEVRIRFRRRCPERDRDWARGLERNPDWRR